MNTNTPPTIHCQPGLSAVIPEHLPEFPITAAFLAEKNACAAGARWFATTFPTGCTYPHLREKLAAENKASWQSWIQAVVGGDIATAGYRGTATAGYRGTATAGDSGTATAGDRGTATAGDSGTATAGYSGTATAGDSGVISIQYWDSQALRFKVIIGYIGEGGLKPGVAYQLDANCQFVEKPAA